MEMNIEYRNQSGFKAFFEKIAEFLNTKYGKNTIELEMCDSYENMAEKIEPHMHLVDNAVKAIEMSGGIANITPIRGGTDGARLSYMGLPCPNLSTGGANFHGVHELIPVESMHKMVQVLVELAKA